MAEKYTPRTTENSTGMALFRCCTAFSCASDSLGGRCPPHYSDEEPYSRRSMRTAATLSLFPSTVGGFDASQSVFHASVEFHWIIFA